MSYTSVYKVYPEKVDCLGVLSNSWLSAPPVWDVLSKKYLGWDMWILKPPEEQQKLWDLPTDFNVPQHWRIVMAMTLDLSVVPPDRLEEAAVACLKVHEELSHRSHWQAIGMALRQIATGLSETPDPTLLGIGLGCTSVVDPWSRFEESEDEEEASETVEVSQVAEPPKTPKDVAWDALAHACKVRDDTLPVEG